MFVVGYKTFFVQSIHCPIAILLDVSLVSLHFWENRLNCKSKQKKNEFNCVSNVIFSVPQLDSHLQPTDMRCMFYICLHSHEYNTWCLHHVIRTSFSCQIINIFENKLFKKNDIFESYMTKCVLLSFSLSLLFFHFFLMCVYLLPFTLPFSINHNKKKNVQKLYVWIPRCSRYILNLNIFSFKP